MRDGYYRIVVAACLGVLAFGPSRAEPFDQATRDALKGVITSQLAALNRGDGTAAEVFASKGIRDRFPDGPAFLAMVRKSYGALIHAKSTVFGAAEGSPDGPHQAVTIVAADGTVWTATYSFEKVGTDWRITGCGLQREEGQMQI